MNRKTWLVVRHLCKPGNSTRFESDTGIEKVIACHANMRPLEAAKHDSAWLHVLRTYTPQLFQHLLLQECGHTLN